MPLEGKWPGRTYECGVSTICWHMCIHMIHTPESRDLCVSVSLCGPMRAEMWLPSMEPPLPMTVTAVEGVTQWQSRRGLELSCSSAPSSALCRGEGGTLFLCLDPLPQNPPAGFASALCRQCLPAAAFGKQKEVPLGAAGGGAELPSSG